MIHDARAVKEPAFTTLPTIDGYDVICADSGRAIDHRDTFQSANGVAYRLNNAAANMGIAAVLGGKKGGFVPKRGR